MTPIKRPARVPRNSRCTCGSGKKYKYCCKTDAEEQPQVVQRPATYIDAGEPAVRYVIVDGKGTGFFVDKTGRILVFASRADAIAVVTMDEFVGAEAGEINVAGVGETKWAHLQATLPFVEVDAETGTALVRERIAHLTAQLTEESPDTTESA
jgi:hypothetical protein